MLNLKNPIKLENDMRRIFFPCWLTDNLRQTILLDTGSPNTVITLKLARTLGLTARPSEVTKIRISGGTMKVVPVVLPSLTMGTLRLENVRVYAGLDENWGDTVLLGLNVLNHLIYAVDRSEGNGFIYLEKNPTQSDFNRLISVDGKYYITSDEEEIIS